MNKKKGSGFLRSITATESAYVLVRQDTEELLGSFREDGNGFSTTGWCKHPSTALVYRSHSEARKMAVSLASLKGVPIDLCSMTDTGAQYRVQAVARFFPGS